MLKSGLVGRRMAMVGLVGGAMLATQKNPGSPC